MMKKSDSGAQKRKNKLERQKRDAKIPKLTNYLGSLSFVPVEDPECSGSSPQLASPSCVVTDPRVLDVEEGKQAAEVS